MMPLMDEPTANCGAVVMIAGGQRWPVAGQTK
jgi:hypothetical protein